jgi:hypothetical protein
MIAIAGGRLAFLGAAALAASLPRPVVAQAGLAAEREEYVRWLGTSATSPAVAVAHRPVGDGLHLGPPEADVPIAGLGPHRLVVERGVVFAEGPSGRRMLARGRPAAAGTHAIVIGGPRATPWVTVFDSAAARHAPSWFAPAPALAFTGPLEPARRAAAVRMLTLDGIEVEATEAGMVRVPIGGDTVALAVRRVPDPSTGEAELEIYFQDLSNGHGTYPAGRFVTLDPLPGGRYRLDFNRARNPFCAYSTAYPCPVPWAGNRIEARVEAGERYVGPGGSPAPGQ